jgi:uncharacterized membrane protein
MVYFRIAGFVLLLISAFHLAGHFLIIPYFSLSKNFAGDFAAGSTEKQLLDLMNNYHREINGKPISMMDIQEGLSLCYALFFAFLGAIAMVIWKPVRRNHRLLARISFLYTAGLLVGMLISMIYFFWLPAVSFFIAALLFLIAGIYFARSRQF